MFRNYSISGILICSALFAGACQQRGKDGKVLDTPTTGSIRIMVDDGYQPIIASAIDVFDSIYRRASMEAIYTSEGEAIDAIIRDSIQVIIVARQLTGEELDKYFRPRGFVPHMTPIAYDGVAFIVHPGNKDTVFTMEQMQAIITGKISSWKMLNPKSPLSDIVLVFDNPLSGTVRYAKDSIEAARRCRRMQRRSKPMRKSLRMYPKTKMPLELSA
ncbi:MAG: substrate-binding domain-containing protein [Saprospirales bacterium]|nr:substrate-binding domain-containing protein [Saprospirales bacterium]